MMFYYDTYVIFDSGSGSTYYDALSDGGDPNWNGANFSYNILGGTMTLKGGDVYAFRDDDSNYWNGNNTQTLNYAVYTSGSTPSFSAFQILAGGSGGSATFQGGNNWRAVNSSGDVNIGSLIDSSGNNWRVAVYFSGNGSFNDGGGVQQTFNMSDDSNGGANYVANVNAFYGATTTGTQSAAFSGTGYFNFNGSGQTYTLDKVNTYTGETQIDAGTVAVTGSLDDSSMIFIGSGANSANAALSLSGTTTLANNIQINVSTGSGTRDLIKADATSQTIAGNITNNRASTINVTNSGGNLNLSGVLGGGSAITKAGAGTLVLSGASANTNSGGLTVTAGEVVFNKSANTAATGSGVTVNSGAVLTMGAANQFGGSALDLDGTLNLGGFNQNLALFNSGTGTINLGGGTLTNNNGNFTDTFSGSIAGNGNFVKAGTGTLILTAGSSFTGSTTVSGGALEIQSATGLGTTAGITTVSDGSALKLFNATSMTIEEALTLSGTGVNGIDGALYNVGGNNTVSGAISLGANTRIGATAGSLSVGAIAGGNHVLFVGGSQNTTISGALGGNGNTQNDTTTSLYKDGGGLLTLSGNNTYSGDTRVTEGTLTVASGGNLGNGTSDVYVSAGANLNVNANAEIASLRESGSFNKGTNTIGSGVTLTVSGNDYSALSTSIRGEGNLIKSGTGTMILVGTQDRTGTTTVSGGRLQSDTALSTTSITVSGGEFATTVANVVADTTAVAVNSGTYTVGGSDTIGALSGSGGSVAISSGNTLTTSFNSAANSYSGGITGDGAFTKAGSGTLTLSGANTKGGANTVSGGKLTVQSGGSLAGATTVQSGATLVADGTLSGAVSVNSGATLEGGGSVGTLTINGVLAPGNSAGTTTATGGSFWNQGGSYEWEIFNLSGPAGTGWDLLSVSGGALDLNGHHLG